MKSLLAPLCALTVVFAATVPAVSAQEAPAAGPARADEADVEFRLGNAAYVRGDYQAALAHYFNSYRLVPNGNVLFNIARCYENADQLVEAHRYYSLYLDVAAAAEQDDVRRALERIGRKVGTLAVETVPAGASIFLDRKDLGEYAQGPAEIVVKPGTYDIIVEADGWFPRLIEDVTVDAGGRVAQKIELVRREGDVWFDGQPANAFVEVLPDGAPQPIEGRARLALPVGKLRVRISAPGFFPAIVDTEVRDADNAPISYALQAQSGSLVVRATEPQASIYVDGELAGFAPVVVDVPVGIHDVVVRAEGFEPFRATVDVPVDGRIEVDATLRGADEVAAASRFAESLADAPASVSLIGSREMNAFGYRGTSDALAGTRGFFVTDDATYLTIGMRGYGPFAQFGNRGLVLIDGHAVNESWIDGSLHEFEISSDLYGYERLEFVRGPTSVLYGSGAFLGVVSLVSPAADDVFTRSRAGGGVTGDGTLRGYAHVQQRFPDGGVRASVGAVHTQPGTFVSPARAEAGEPSVAEGVGGMSAQTARINATWRDFSLYSMWHARDKQTPTGAYETIFGDSRTREADTRGFADLRHALALGERHQLHNRVYVDYYGYEGRFAYPAADGGVYGDDFSGIWAGLESRLELQPFARARWSTSLEGVRHVLHRWQSSDDEGELGVTETPFWKTSVATTFRYDLSRQFSAWAGLRYDLWAFDSLPSPDGESAESRIIQNANPRLVLIWRPVDSSTFKLIGARGFRAPSVYELTYNDGGLTQIAAPALTPETLWSAELEYTQRLVERVEGVVALYTQAMRNRIEAIGAGDETDPLQYRNLDEDLWAAGLELELRRPFFRGWMAVAQFAYQRTRDGELDALFQTGPNVPNSPRAAGSVKVIAPIIPRSLLLANRLVFEGARLDRERNATDPGWLWDVVLSGQATTLPVRWSLGIRNLLDWRVEHPVGDEILDVRVVQPGRTFTADLAVTF